MSLLPCLRYQPGLSRAPGFSLAIAVGNRRRLGIPSPVTVRWLGGAITLRPRESDPDVASSVPGLDENGVGERAQAAQIRLAACR
jgi:hypothetical protein